MKKLNPVLLEYVHFSPEHKNIFIANIELLHTVIYVRK